MNSLFPMVKFTDEEVNSFKIRQAKKNEKFKFNNLERKVDTRWIGMACEEGLKVLLDSKGIKYVYHADDNKIDDQDFTIGEFEIDVKSVSTSYYPKTHYACNIPDHQWKKIMREGNIINLLLFSRFLLPTNEAIYLGIITKKALKGQATFYKKGTVRGKITLNTDNWEIPINELQSIESFLTI